MRILLGIDGSPSSIKARDLIAGLPWPPDTVIDLVAAYQAPIDWTGGVASRMAVVGDAAEAVLNRLGEQLRELGEPLAARGWVVEPRVITERPATAIVAAAAEFDADLVVVGSRGHGTLRSMLLGSVAAEVVNLAPCPVLVARVDHVSHALIATDGSPTARAIPEVLRRWNILRGVRAEVLSVAPGDSPAYELMVGLYTLGNTRTAEERKDLLDQCRGDADEAVGSLAASGIEAEAHVRSGDAADEIVSAASEWGVDLIVTGSRGLGGLEQLLLGSVARNVVLHARCSVLVLRGPAEP
jgi:nucleotide-binding universal stress UspA family protein